MQAMNPPSPDHRWRAGLWLSALAMLIALFAQGMAQDIGFWRTWISALQAGGYRELADLHPPANYPPLMLHWFRLLAWLQQALGIGTTSDLLVKAWTVLPVLLSQLVVVQLVAKALLSRGRDPLESAAFWLTVFNPAFLLDGPIWGQVDLLPFLPLYLAMMAALDRRHAIWTLPLLALALLCKFQAIVFAPVIAGLALVHWRRQLAGAAIAALLVWLFFAPFMVADGIWPAMARAYWSNVGAFPYFSLNAANFWYLFAGGSHVQTPATLLTGDWATSPLAPWVSAARIGMMLFAVIGLYALVRAWRRRDLGDALGLAVFCAVGFFVVSTAMHERYLFLALPFCALWVSHRPQYRLWYPLLTALVFLNISFVLSLANATAWKMLSVAMIAAFIGLALQFMSRRFVALAEGAMARSSNSAAAPYAVLGAAWLAIVMRELARAAAPL